MIEHRLERQTGTAFELMKGQLLRVIDLEGEQVAASNRSATKSSTRSFVTRLSGVCLPGVLLARSLGGSPGYKPEVWLTSN